MAFPTLKNNPIMLKQMRILIVFLIVFLNYNNTCAQKAKIKLVSAEEIDNKLIITYNIVDYKPEEVFNIELVVLDASGKKLGVKTVKGAVGKTGRNGVPASIMAVNGSAISPAPCCE